MRFGSPRRGARRGLSVLAVGALALGALVATPIAANAASVNVTDVTFDWALNNESSGGAYFGGCNFPSAGVAGNTGSSRVWSESDGFLKAEEGNTRIVKPTADGTGTQPITWDNRCLQPNGEPLVRPTSNDPASYTKTRVQIGNGTGTVDVASQDATIQWTGSFTAAYYGGMTYWSATDPKLTVVDGKGTLTATVSGYGASMEDASVWKALTPRVVSLADLSNVTVTAQGIQVQPDYLGVAIPDDVAGRNAQAALTDANRSWWGAFPADFQRFQIETGQSSYWYTSDGGPNSIQPRKVAAPLSVTYVAPVPVAITTPPVAQSVSLGETATFSVAADGATGYQWQSAPTGSSTWTDVADATAATFSLTGTTATAKQYRVVVAGAGGPVTSSAVALTVAVPTPTVVVSKTAGLDPEGETITITGSGFLPNPPATSGTRPPFANQFTGAYVAFGRFADVWKPSAGVGREARVSDPDSTQWALHAAQIDGIGGPSAATVEISPAGTFSTSFTVKKSYEGIPSTGNFGIYTYPGGGAAYPAFETYTPLTFTVPVPDAPAAPAVALGDSDTSVDVSWTAPDDNDEPISGYDVTLTPATGAASTVSVGADARSTTFSGLVRGQSYTATVVANNAGGSSAASAASASVVIPAVAPSAPTDVVATAAGTTSVNVAWSAPANDGGADITGYTVSVSKGGDVVATVDTATTSATVTGLELGTAYRVSVVAKNTAGTSSASAPASVTTLAEVPATLAAPTVTAASGTGLNVQWVAPADGGSPITAYVVTVLRGADVVKTVEVGAVTTTTVDGLQNGTRYTVTVAAKNAQGVGPASPASAAVRTFSAPDAPVVSAELDGATGVSADWSAPADGGSAVTGYTAQLITGGQVVQTKTPADTSVTFGSLTPGAAYTVSVTATNAVGTSAAGVSGAVTVPAVAPGAPGTPSTTLGADGTSAIVTWTAPVSDGGSPITGYELAISTGSSGDSLSLGADARSYALTGLSAGTYTVSVTAVTGAGKTASESVAVTIAGPAPTADPVVVPASALVGESGGDATITIDGSTVTIDAGAEQANTWIGVSVHSDPRFLGWFLVDASGFATVTLPSDLAAGTHHLVVQDTEGAVLGYQAFTVDAPQPAAPVAPVGDSTNSAEKLAVTGTNGDLIGWSVLAALLLLLGGGAALLTRRKASV